MRITQDIKGFLEQEGKVLIVEDGEPQFVLVRFSDYMRAARGAGTKAGEAGLRVEPHRTTPTVERGAARALDTSDREREILEINRELEALAVGDDAPRVFYKEPE